MGLRGRGGAAVDGGSLKDVHLQLAPPGRRKSTERAKEAGCLAMRFKRRYARHPVTDTGHTPMPINIYSIHTKNSIKSKYRSPTPRDAFRPMADGTAHPFTGYNKPELRGYVPCRGGRAGLGGGAPEHYPHSLRWGARPNLPLARYPDARAPCSATARSPPAL